MIKIVYPKRIVLAFSTYPGKELLKEIFTQLEGSVRIDYAPTGSDLLYYLTKNARRRLPGLIIFDSPPRPNDLAPLVRVIRKEAAFGDIPMIFFLPAGDISVIQSWFQDKDLYYYPRPATPSGCKFYLRQMLEHYSEPKAVTGS